MGDYSENVNILLGDLIIFHRTRVPIQINSAQIIHGEMTFIFFSKEGPVSPQKESDMERVEIMIKCFKNLLLQTHWEKCN